MKPSRRKFLKSAAAHTTLASCAAIGVSAAVPNVLLGAATPGFGNDDERILVVVQLSGGNDGLNTVVPYADEDYYKNRFTLAIGKGQVRKINDDIGLHPQLSGFEELLNNNSMAIVQGVGYPKPNRSHFESMDLWHTSHQAAASKLTGWLGRTVESGFEGHDLPAIHFGAGLQPLALKTDIRPVPSIRSIDQFKLELFRDPAMKKQLTALVKRQVPESNSLLGYVYDSANVAVETSQKLEALVENTNSEFSYPQTQLGRNLGVVAKLIGSGLKTRIYYTTLDGFDTHSNQAAAHGGLLRNLGDSVNAFMKEINAQGNADRVCLFSFSEFGRRVRENASRGTDHGTAAPVFIMGKGLKSNVFGSHPSLTDLDQGDLKFHTDYRSVYSDLLQNWLGIPSQKIVGGDFSPLGLFS